MESFEKPDVPIYNVDVVTGKLGDRSLVDGGRGRGKFIYNVDVFKTLDEVVMQRGIIKPPSYKTRIGDDGELPITGRNARSFRDSKAQNEGGTNGVDLVKIDGGGGSMSLDDLIGKSRGRGRRFNRTGGEKKSAEGARGVDDYDGATTFTSNNDDGRRRRFGRDQPQVGADLTIKLNKDLDPKSASLDDLIVEGNDRGENRERGFKRKSYDRQNGAELDVIMEVDNEEGEGEKLKRPRFSRPTTPYRAVEFLSVKGMIIQVRVGKLVEENKDVAHLWRCEIMSGDLSGIAESSRKTVAREIAAREFLKKLKEVYPDGKIPRYKIPDELYLDPKVFKKLDELAAQQELGISNMITIDRDPDGGSRKSLFKCTWVVDDNQFVGESSDMDYAKLEAAGKAYASITGEAFPKTTYFVGESCKTDYEFIYNESEIYYSEEDQTKALEEAGDASAIL